MQGWYHQHRAIISMSEAWTSELLNFGAGHCLTSFYFFNPFKKRDVTFCWCRFTLPLSSVLLLLSVVLSIAVEDWLFSVIHALFTRYFSLTAVIKLLALCALLSHERVLYSYSIITDLYLNFLPLLLHILFDFPLWQGVRKETTYCRLRKNYSLNF